MLNDLFYSPASCYVWLQLLTELCYFQCPRQRCPRFRPLHFAPPAHTRKSSTPLSCRIRHLRTSQRRLAATLGKRIAVPCRAIARATRCRCSRSARWQSADSVADWQWFRLWCARNGPTPLAFSSWRQDSDCDRCNSSPPPFRAWDASAMVTRCSCGRI